MKGSQGEGRTRNPAVNSRVLCRLSYLGTELPQTLASKVQLGATGCWIWTGATQTKGYGSTTDGTGRGALAHRRVYELLVGPIPAGFAVVHACRTRLCVNPEHLFTTADPAGYARLSRTPAPTCRHGHDTSDIDSRDGTGYCRQCKRIKSAKP